MKWGRWLLVEENLTLTYVDDAGRYGYEIDLERIRSSAEMLDWIFQVSLKTWMTDEDRGYLLKALEELYQPQANLCSFGRHMTIPNVKKFLKGQIRQLNDDWERMKDNPPPALIENCVDFCRRVFSYRTE